jgi:diguanylate cyclase (GGDEF)-like protein
MPLASGSITLVKENERQIGFLAFLPVYETNPTTGVRHMDNLLGFIVAVYRIGDIVIRSRLSDVFFEAGMRLVDETQSPKQVMFHIDSLNTSVEVDEDMVYRKELPAIWGRKWSLIATPTRSLINERMSYTPLVVAVFGMILVALIAAHLYKDSKYTALVLDLSRTDGLTGIPNRRYLDEYLKREWSRSSRLGSYLTYILIDIDFFKQYNDNYGHLAGDECLKIVAQSLRDVLSRESDFIARYGGEEFAIVLPDTANATSVANRCRACIERLRIPHAFSEVAKVVTVSVGVGTLIPRKETAPDSLMNCADRSLYRAKKSGRNRIEQIRIPPRRPRQEPGINATRITFS